METSAFSEFDLISHPHQSLAKHLDGCDRISTQILAAKHFEPAFYPMGELEAWRKHLVYYHDFGKGTDFFQHRIIQATEKEGDPEFAVTQKDYMDWFKKKHSIRIAEELHLSPELGRHAQLGGYFLFGTYGHPDSIVELILLKVIHRHHGHLTDFLASGTTAEPVVYLNGGLLERMSEQKAKMSFELYNKILASVELPLSDPGHWDRVQRKFGSIILLNRLEMQLQEADTLRYFFLQHYLFSLLLSADKGDMQLPRNNSRHGLIRANHVIDPAGELVEKYKTAVFEKTETKAIDIQREQAFRDIARHAVEQGANSFFSITLPTGMGKTFAAYKAAFVLQQGFATETGTKPRIVYCLPFTSVIDQNAAILQDIFEKGQLDPNWVSVHHYLSHYNEKYDDSEQKYVNFDFPASEYMTEGWEQDVVVTTFVQLLESIFTNRNRAIRKFHNLAHAVVVLDEVQAIPPKYFNAIEAAFRCFSEYFGTKFIFVTATQPTLFTSSSDIVELTDPGKIKTRQYFEQMNRITLDQSLLSRTKYAEMDFEEVKSFVWEDIQNNSELSFLVICNTIRQSQEMYQFLKAKVGSAYPIRYLSSSIIPYCRKQIISEVKAHKGPQILVSTQVVEAGVDIDFDVVWRDWAPLDSINQSAGRCNRNGVKGKGRVKLFHAGKARHIYGSQLLSATESVLKKEAFGEVIPEAQFYTLNTDYAAAVWKAVADDNSKSKKIIEAMKHLNLETLNAAFKLIDDACLSYNVFIPINQQAMEVWSRYMENCKIEDRFERKTAMKLLRPELMPFVTKFPKNRYDPPEGQKDNYIIFTPYWEENYDLALGFVHDNLEDKYI